MQVTIIKKKSYPQIQSHFELLGDNAATYTFWRRHSSAHNSSATVQPIICFNCLFCALKKIKRKIRKNIKENKTKVTYTFSIIVPVRNTLGQMRRKPPIFWGMTSAADSHLVHDRAFLNMTHIQCHISFPSCPQLETSLRDILASALRMDNLKLPLRLHPCSTSNISHFRSLPSFLRTWLLGASHN